MSRKAHFLCLCQKACFHVCIGKPISMFRVRKPVPVLNLGSYRNQCRYVTGYLVPIKVKSQPPDKKVSSQASNEELQILRFQTQIHLRISSFCLELRFNLILERVHVQLIIRQVRSLHPVPLVVISYIHVSHSLNIMCRMYAPKFMESVFIAFKHK